MRAYVRFRTPDRETHDLCPGDIIGRLWSAALRVDHARVSEAHALISLRGQHLKMLSLRGVLAVNGKRHREVVLLPGVTVQLARDYVIEVLAVELPDAVLALQLPGLPPQELTSAVYSLVREPAPGLVPGGSPDAIADVWSTGEGWRLKHGEAPSVSLEPGLEIDVDGVTVRVATVPLGQAALTDTRMAGRLHEPVRIVARYDTAHLYRERQDVLSLGGLSARILSELVTFDGPAPWEVVARQVWREKLPRDALRHKWDVNLSRLRIKLRKAGLRPDLLRSDGSGTIELVLLPGDVVVDET
jgi:hypothetical protein